MHVLAGVRIEISVPDANNGGRCACNIRKGSGAHNIAALIRPHGYPEEEQSVYLYN